MERAGRLECGPLIHKFRPRLDLSRLEDQHGSGTGDKDAVLRPPEIEATPAGMRGESGRSLQPFFVATLRVH
jgi:hypothetical protein